MTKAKKDESNLSVLLCADTKIRGTSPYSYRTGEWAIITGVKTCTPDGLESRIVFVCKYDDGFIDYIPLHDKSNYEFDTQPNTKSAANFREY
jgi:hypothetical protein